MTNGTKEDGLREQAVRSLNGIAGTNNRLNLESRQPLRGLSAYERLRGEFIATTPMYTEAELLAACIVFAKACGLILREKVLQQQLREAQGYDTK